MTRQGRSAQPAETPSRSESVDRYLETIYCLAGEGETVRPSRVADWLNVSAPTVSVALQKLARDGWIDIAANRSISLTPLGETASRDIVRRHRLLERWLTDVLHFDWATAHIEAERLAPATSDDVLSRLDEALDHPTTCPHGNAIPGRSAPYGELIALADLEPDVPARVRRISEIIEHEALQLLRELDEYGVHAGVEVRVASSEGTSGALALSVAGRTMALTTATARLIWVEIVTAPATVLAR